VAYAAGEEGDMRRAWLRRGGWRHELMCHGGDGDGDTRAAELTRNAMT